MMFRELITIRHARWESYTNEWGEPHREDGPALQCIEPGRTEYMWYLHGELHRIGGPAVVNQKVTQWWVNGQLHREDGPALTFGNGSEEWWWKNLPHRDDGPAFIESDGSVRWFLMGDEFSSEEEWRRALPLYENKENF